MISETTAYHIAVIGGGPGGLLAAHLLSQRCKHQCEITIFEASNRLGGKIRTANFEAAPVRYEAGAAELYDYSLNGPDPLSELVRDLGLSRRPLTGSTVIIGDLLLNNDQDIRRAFGQETYTALKEFARKAKSLISPGEYYESDWKADNEVPLARQSFAELLDSVSDPMARRYISASIHSDVATEPHHTNAMYGLQNYLMNEPGYMSLYTIDGGIEALIHELASRTTAAVKLGHRVTLVEKSEEDTYRICSRTREQNFEEICDFVIVALPNNWIPAIEWGGEKLARAMRNHHVHYDHPAHYLRVSILFSKPFWREQITGSYFMSDAFGGCCIYDETSRVDGCEFGALGWLLAGEAALTLCNFDDATLIAEVMDRLPASLRHGRELFLEGHVHRWAGSVNGLPAGYPAKNPDARHQPEPEDHPSLFLVGDYLFDSTLNGVMDSADTVAEWIAEEIQD